MDMNDIMDRIISLLRLLKVQDKICGPSLKLIFASTVHYFSCQSVHCESYLKIILEQDGV